MVRLVVNASTGETVHRRNYDEFGAVLFDSSPGFIPFGFAGGLYDHETGLVRFGARDYDAAVGRWTAKDPIGFAGGQMVLYSYVGNDPINYIDFLGFDKLRYAIYMKDYADQVEVFEQFYRQFVKNGDELKVKYFEPGQKVQMIEFLKEGDKCAIGAHGALGDDAIYHEILINGIKFRDLNTDAELAKITIFIDACFAQDNLPPAQDVYPNLQAAKGTKGLIDVAKAGMRALGIDLP